jgi:hypothetical protein
MAHDTGKGAVGAMAWGVAMSEPWQGLHRQALTLRPMPTWTRSLRLNSFQCLLSLGVWSAYGPAWGSASPWPVSSMKWLHATCRASQSRPKHPATKHPARLRPVVRRGTQLKVVHRKAGRGTPRALAPGIERCAYRSVQETASSPTRTCPLDNKGFLHRLRPGPVRLPSAEQTRRAAYHRGPC